MRRRGLWNFLGDHIDLAAGLFHEFIQFDGPFLQPALVLYRFGRRYDDPCGDIHGNQNP